ncbi:hypothetical protein ABPG75_008805 [Micractinium tetrahymenae]
MEVDDEAAPAEADQASPAAQAEQAARELRSPSKKEVHVELQQDTLKAIDIVCRIAEQVPAPEPPPEAAAEGGGGRKPRRPWMPDPIRKALNILSPIYMREVEQQGQAATRRVLDLLMPFLDPFASRHRVSVMLRSSQKEKQKRKAAGDPSGAEEPRLALQEAAAAAFRDLQASAGEDDDIMQVAAQTRWLVRHLKGCGVAPEDAQEYRHRWVLQPAVRQSSWEELGRLVPAEDWEGVQRHVRLAITGGRDSGEGGKGGSAAS